ncbi:hypothetical protein F511_44325 [Dorcoceras hygrometricum]|uniref:Uncharacterized protein n=1 Tax=Dorcoceras hygrometricum TaxID=472368 RepID=A0A2Z7BIP0_9LAMI|nr:hypothetical protein F511_44325 [Dorcoceras hygrometricum]
MNNRIRYDTQHICFWKFGPQCPTSPLLPPRKDPLEDLILQLVYRPNPTASSFSHTVEAVVHLRSLGVLTAAGCGIGSVSGALIILFVQEQRAIAAQVLAARKILKSFIKSAAADLLILFPGPSSGIRAVAIQEEEESQAGAGAMKKSAGALSVDDISSDVIIQQEATVE